MPEGEVDQPEHGMMRLRVPSTGERRGQTSVSTSLHC